MGGGLRKGTMAFVCLCLGECCLPAPALIPDTSVPPCMPLVPFKLLPWCWSWEGVSLSKFVCSFFKRNCLALQKFLPPTQSPQDFCSQKLWGPNFLALEPWVRDLVWSWDSLFLIYPSWNSSATCGCGTSLFHVSAPPTILDGCGFFESVVVRLPCNSVSDSLSDSCSIF